MMLQNLTPEMLNVVAKKAMLPLAILVVIGGGIIYLTDSLTQTNQRLEFQIDSYAWSIEENRDRIANIEEEFSVIKEKSRRYNEIDEIGFIGQQERLAAAELLETLGRKYNLLDLTFTFEPELVQPYVGESGTEFNLVKTLAVVTLGGLADYDLMGFMAEFLQSLGGQVQVNAMVLQKTEDIDDLLLFSLAAGNGSPLFEGSLKITWNNIVRVDPEEEKE